LDINDIDFTCAISNMSGFTRFANAHDGNLQIGDIAIGLNIEGSRPSKNLPNKCDWFNLILAVDQPLIGDTFDRVMERVKDNNHEYIEQAIANFDVNKYIDDLVKVINSIKLKKYKNMLIHVHQYSGTTTLDRTIEDITGIRTITDNTNYYDEPVNYKDQHPQIDCLISLSQCASLSDHCKAGAFIVPKMFMEYDVKHKIVYTNSEVAMNNIVEHLSGITYQYGNILMVNDLWNPSEDDIMNEGVLLLDEKDQQVLEFVKENTKIFDDSHNWEHAVCVAYNSTKILNNKHVLYLALLHDVCDHKYKESIDRNVLSKFIDNNLNEYKIIDEYIELISFSKQKSFDTVDPILEAVRDGDRLEAIGEIGIRRCVQFVESRGGKVPQDVVQHCYDKLLKIYPGNYITSGIGRSMAIKHHNAIVKYVRDHETNNGGCALPEYL